MKNYLFSEVFCTCLLDLEFIFAVFMPVSVVVLHFKTGQTLNAASVDAGTALELLLG